MTGTDHFVLLFPVMRWLRFQDESDSLGVMPIITYLNRKLLVLGEVGGLDSKSILYGCNIYGLYSQWILTPASGRLVQLTKKSKMVDPIQIVAHEGIDKDFSTQIRTWANEVLERTGSLPPRPYLCISIWKTIERFQAFYREEKEALGVITGEETDFLATHDAWRGYPRIHICQERLGNNFQERLEQAVLRLITQF